MSNIEFNFTQPWFLLLIIPAFLLSFWPYFRLPKQHRKTRNRITSMVLHLIVVTLSVLLLSGMTFDLSRVDSKRDVMIVVDQSHSSLRSSDKMNDFVEDIIAETTDAHRVGIVTFANGTIYVAPLNTNKDAVYQSYLNASMKPDQAATNIASALTYAHQQLQNPSDGRIILMTDGRETDGRASVVARGIANTGTKIDVVYFPSYQGEHEVQINRLTVPGYVSLGANMTISVTIQSSQVGSAVLKLYDNDLPIGSASGHPLSLSGNVDTFVFDYSFSTARLHEIRAEIVSDNDEVAENNVYYAYVNIDGSSNHVLIVDGTGNESNQLHNLLSGTYNMDVINVNAIPSSLSYLRQYDEIILMNVANADLPADFDQLLESYVNNYGGGLLTIGGDKAYQQSDMQGSIYENMLPVFASTDQKSLAVMLVIDASTSMNNNNKINLAKQGAIASVNALKDSDVLGVITFNSNVTVMIGPTQVSRKGEIIDAINNISTQIGTQYAAGIQAAKNQLDNFPGHANFDKHIIFLTDGEPQDTGYMAVIAQLGNISMSTIVVGRDNNVSPDTVESMVHVVDGRGQFHDVVNAADLPSIMLLEVQTVAGSYINEATFTPTIENRTEVVASLYDLPTLGGYYGTTSKPDTTIILVNDSDPIYASWNYGNGRVGSFMSDLNGHWSQNFLNDARGQLFILNAVKYLLPDTPVVSYDMSADFVAQNFTTNIRVTTNIPDGSVIEAIITNPLGQTTSIDLAKLAPIVAGGSFETGIPGIYQIELKKKTITGEVISERVLYTAFSYSVEYNSFYNDTQVFEQVKVLASSGNGEILFTANNMFSVEAETITQHINPNVVLLITALVLFLLDIIARKFKFKWPHEIWRSIKNRQGKTAA